MAQEEVFVVPPENRFLFEAPDEDRLVPVLLEDGTPGELRESELEVKRGREENDNEIALWVEYRRPGQDRILHRSAHLHLKTPVTGEAIAANIG